jgi:hypothetical protein
MWAKLHISITDVPHRPNNISSHHAGSLRPGDLQRESYLHRAMRLAAGNNLINTNMPMKEFT